MAGDGEAGECGAEGLITKRSRKMKFAANTEVSVEKSKAEIETCVTRYGASSFVSGWMGNRATIGFEIGDRRLRFILPLPDRNDDRFRNTPGGKRQRSENDAYRAWEQACRQLWRALCLCIKAKLEAVESQISTFDDEFMAHIVLPSGLTMGEVLIPQMAKIISSGKLPPLLPGPSTRD